MTITRAERSDGTAAGRVSDRSGGGFIVVLCLPALLVVPLVKERACFIIVNIAVGNSDAFFLFVEFKQKA